jgi:hypothetical protein
VGPEPTTNGFGQVFRSVNGNSLTPATYRYVRQRARDFGLAPPTARHGDAQAALRSAPLRITPRLYAGVAPKQVVQWAGHSVEVLHKVYSQILDGFDDTWFDRIDHLLNPRAEPGP